MPVVKRLLIAVLAIALSLVAPRPAVAAPSATEALAQATTYLSTTIGSDDHLSSEFGNEGITADAVLALAASGDPAQKPTIDKLVTWLQGQAKAYTAKSPEGAAKLALVAAATATDPTSFGGVDLVAVINKGIAKDGAFGSFPGAFAQSLGIIALSRAGATVPTAMADWLLSQQEKDGGFSYQLGKPADADNTGLAAVALAALGTPDATASLTKAIAWATKNQQADGSWQGFSPVNSTAVMGMGLIAAKADPAKALAYLAGQQLADGALPNAGKADLLATVQGMLTLAGQPYLTVSTATEAPASASPSSAPATPAATPAGSPGGVGATLGWLALAAVVAGGAALVVRRRRS